MLYMPRVATVMEKHLKNIFSRSLVRAIQEGHTEIGEFKMAIAVFRKYTYFPLWK